MKAFAYLTVVLAIALGYVGIVQAHEVRPGYLQIKQVDALTYDLLWKVPAKGDRRLGLYVRLPGHCRSSETTSSFVDGAYIERWRTDCEGGLKDGTIAIDGLEATRTDVLARVEDSNGNTQTVRLTPSQPEFKVMGTTGPAAVVRTYFKLGGEQILLGFDHLLFVLALLFGYRPVIATRISFLLSQGGEFGFVLFGSAMALQVISDKTFVMAIGVISISMLLTPILVRIGDVLVNLRFIRREILENAMRTFP